MLPLHPTLFTAPIVYTLPPLNICKKGLTSFVKMYKTDRMGVPVPQNEYINIFLVSRFSKVMLFVYFSICLNIVSIAIINIVTQKLAWRFM